MPFNKPQDRVLSGVLPFLPAAIAFVLLCLLLVSSERMLSHQLQKRAGAHVEQSSRLFATQLSRLIAQRSTERLAHAVDGNAEPWRDAMPLDATDIEDLRQLILGPEDGRNGLELDVVHKEAQTWGKARPRISENEWSQLLASPEGVAHTVRDVTGEPYVLSHFALAQVDASRPAPGAWQVMGSQPLSQAMEALQPFRRNLLAWGGGIAVLLAFAGFALSHYLARYQHEQRQRLREQGELLSAAIDSAGDAIVSVDLEGCITQFNPAAARIFGHEAADMLGQPLSTLLPQTSHLDYLLRATTSPNPTGQGRITGMGADGQLLDLEASVSHMTVRGNRIVTAILRDVTERVYTERALVQHQRALSGLTRRLLFQEKQTTRKLAQTMHDQLGQTLGAMRLSFDALLGMLPEPLTPKLKERARVLGQLIDTANAQVRQALVALRPPLLDEEGLQAALKHEVQARASDAEPVELQLQMAPEVEQWRWPADVEHAAFMVAREAMANALLHANAHKVVLRIEGHADRLELSVTDDGVGLNQDMAAGRPGHLGIVGMRERALAIGACLQAHRLQEGGTIVSLTWETPSHTSLPQRHTQDNDCANLPHHE